MDEKKESAINKDDIPVIKERKRWLFFGLPLTFTKYILDSKRLKLCTGFLNITEEDLLLYRVMDVTVKRSLFQRMVKLGTIIIISSDKTNPTLVVKNIKHINTFKDALDERVENERLRMRFKTGELIGTDSDDSDDNEKN